MKLKLLFSLYVYFQQQQKKEQKSMCITGSRSDARESNNVRQMVGTTLNLHFRITHDSQVKQKKLHPSEKTK